MSQLVLQFRDTSLFSHTLFAILATLFLFLIYKTLKNPTAGKNPPPSPPSLPVIGNIDQLGPHPHRDLQTLSRIHGPELMLLRLGSVPFVVVSSADAAREIMKANELAFLSRPRSISAEKLLYNYGDIGSAPYSEYWRQAKSV